MQLDLLTWRPQCQIIAFPSSKKLGRVRQVASVLLARNGKAADAYWRRTVECMVRQMRRASISEPTIESEVRAFFDAVQAELLRQAQSDRRGGAA